MCYYSATPNRLNVLIILCYTKVDNMDLVDSYYEPLATFGYRKKK